jgi:hypothetical protein
VFQLNREETGEREERASGLQNIPGEGLVGGGGGWQVGGRRGAEGQNNSLPIFFYPTVATHRYLVHFKTWKHAVVRSIVIAVQCRIFKWYKLYFVGVVCKH